MQGDTLPYLFEQYKKLGMYDKNIEECEMYFSFFDDEHLIPDRYLKKLEERGIKK